MLACVTELLLLSISFPDCTSLRFCIAGGMTLHVFSPASGNCKLSIAYLYSIFNRSTPVYSRGKVRCQINLHRYPFAGRAAIDLLHCVRWSVPNWPMRVGDAAPRIAGPPGRSGYNVQAAGDAWGVAVEFRPIVATAASPPVEHDEQYCWEYEQFERGPFRSGVGILALLLPLVEALGFHVSLIRQLRSGRAVCVPSISGIARNQTRRIICRATMPRHSDTPVYRCQSSAAGGLAETPSDNPCASTTFPDIQCSHPAQHAEFLLGNATHAESSISRAKRGGKK